MGHEMADIFGLDAEELIEDFEMNINKNNNTGAKKNCWIWIGRTDKAKTAKFALKHPVKNIPWDTTAARASYRIYIGEIPIGYRVTKICKNKDCVKPQHFLLKNNKIKPEEIVPRNLFTQDQILAIRHKVELEYKRTNNLKIVYSNLTTEYNTTEIAIHIIITRQVWGDLHILKKDRVDED